MALISNKKNILSCVLGGCGILHLAEMLPRRRVLIGLNYHRIGNIMQNPYDDGVFSANADGFRRQVQYLKKHYDILSIEQMERLMVDPVILQKPAVIITFDDGYRDNYDIAFPILKEEGVIGVFFIPTSFIDNPVLPWWDQIAFIVKKTLKTRLILSLPVAGTVVDIDNKDNALVAIRSLHELYHSCTLEMKNLFLKDLAGSANVIIDAEQQGQGLFMKWDHIREMSKSGMDFGSHGHSHTILTELNETQLRDDYMQSKTILEQKLGSEISAVSYPGGRPDMFSGVTMKLAAEAGYRLGFSFYDGINDFDDAIDPFNIKRMDVSLHENFLLFRSKCIMHTVRFLNIH